MQNSIGDSTAQYRTLILYIYNIELVCLWIGRMGLYPCYDYKSTCSATNSFYFVLCRILTSNMFLL